MINDTRPRPPSPIVEVNRADNVEKIFDSIDLNKERDPSESPGAMSDCRKATSKKSSRVNKKSSSNKRDDIDEIFLLKQQYREKKNEYLQKLIRRRKAEDDESKAKILKRKIVDNREDLDNIQDQIRRFKAHKIEHESKEGKCKHVVRPMKVKIQASALPIFRLEAASLYLFKQYGED